MAGDRHFAFLPENDGRTVGFDPQQVEFGQIADAQQDLPETGRDHEIVFEDDRMVDPVPHDPFPDGDVA